jgi:hypothetical protein
LNRSAQIVHQLVADPLEMLNIWIKNRAGYHRI